MRKPGRSSLREGKDSCFYWEVVAVLEVHSSCLPSRGTLGEGMLLADSLQPRGVPWGLAVPFMLRPCPSQLAPSWWLKDGGGARGGIFLPNTRLFWGHSWLQSTPPVRCSLTLLMPSLPSFPPPSMGVGPDLHSGLKAALLISRPSPLVLSQSQGFPAISLLYF